MAKKNKDEAIHFAGHFQAVVEALSARCTARGFGLASVIALLAQPRHSLILDIIADVFEELVSGTRELLEIVFVPGEYQYREGVKKEIELPEGYLLLELVPLDAPSERSDSGYRAMDRAVAMGANGGQRLAHFLERNQEKIPQSFRGKMFEIAFFGTVRDMKEKPNSLGSENGAYPQGVLVLRESGAGRWFLAWESLEGYWSSRTRVLRPYGNAT